jgi:hypothetical protein
VVRRRHAARWAVGVERGAGRERHERLVRGRRAGQLTGRPRCGGADRAWSEGDGARSRRRDGHVLLRIQSCADARMPEFRPCAFLKLRARSRTMSACTARIA